MLGGIQNVSVRRFLFRNIHGSANQPVHFGDFDDTIFVCAISTNQFTIGLFDAELSTNQRLECFGITLFNDERRVLVVLDYNRVNPAFLQYDFLPISGKFVSGGRFNFLDDIGASDLQALQQCLTILTCLDIPILIGDRIGDTEDSTFQFDRGVISVHLGDLNGGFLLIDEGDSVFFIVIFGKNSDRLNRIFV